MLKKFPLLIPLFIILIGVLAVTSYFFINKKQTLARNTYTGMLSVSTSCGLPEGCGPKYKMYDQNLKTFVPLLGDINEKDNDLIIKVTGNKVPLPQSEYKDMNYRGPTEAIQVSSYKVMSAIPYQDFLVTKANEYTIKKYPCLAHAVNKRAGTNYDKSFSWELTGNIANLKVKLSGEKGSYELWYDGRTGSFIKEITEPKGIIFCP